jgi:hypothetical protein
MGTLKKLLEGDVCDVPVEATLTDGSRIVFWCDGVQGGKDPRLTGSYNGCTTFVPASEIRSVKLLTKPEWAQLSQGKPVWWYRG